MTEEGEDKEQAKEEGTPKKKQTKPQPKRKRRKKASKAKPRSVTTQNAPAKYPRHTVDKALRIPKAILDQNAGKKCSEAEAVGFLGFKLSGELRSEISSAVKFGFLERPAPGRIKLTDLGRKILRPQEPKDEIEGLREAVFEGTRNLRCL